MKGSKYAQVPTGKRQAYQFRRPNTLRDKALILILLATGVRVGELTRLRVGDVYLENGEVYICPFHVKKTHSRTTYLGKAARKALWRYLVGQDSDRPEKHKDSLMVFWPVWMLEIYLYSYRIKKKTNQELNRDIFALACYNPIEFEIHVRSLTLVPTFYFRKYQTDHSQHRTHVDRLGESGVDNHR